MNNAKSVRAISCLLIILASCGSKKEKIRIACVGDSITEGYGLSNENLYSYPSVLQKVLGVDYVVLNAGRSSATVQKSGNRPYWNTKDFSNVFAFQPDVIILKLGTNDTKPVNWVETSQFREDYLALIDTLKSIATDPSIFLCTPAPVFQTSWGINDSTLTSSIIPAIKAIGTQDSLALIDLNQHLQNQQVNFEDGVHPNEQAAKSIAHIIASIIRDQQ